MAVHDIVMGAAGASGVATYIEDVFSTYLYTGTGATQTITNGIDLSTKGGLTWIKGRSGVTGHRLTDTTRGTTKSLASETAAAEVTETTGLTAFGTTGFTIGADTDYNTSAETYASWTFRKQPKFFDIVTWTGNGANRTISHSLGAVPACIMVKRTDTTGDWQVYHSSLANTEYLVLNTTAAKATGATRWNSTTPTSSVFSLGTDATVNANAGTYVAYIYAHNAGGFGVSGTDNVISCGSFTINASAQATVNLGYEPQFVLVKNVTRAGNWAMLDTMRGWVNQGTSTQQGGTGDWELYPNTTAAEAQNSSVFYYSAPTATGFVGEFAGSPSDTYIYIAIRRPNKPPTTGTQVYNAIARTGTGAAATVTGVGFAPDLVHVQQRSSAGNDSSMWDRLRGIPNWIATNTTIGEASVTNEVTSLTMDGMTVGTSTSNLVNPSGSTYINHFFKRAKGFFDIVCYTGTGVARTVNHNLGVVPELMIVKTRNAYNFWYVYSSPTGNTKRLLLDQTNEAAVDNPWNNTSPTSSAFTVIGSNDGVNFSGTTYVAYLFATLAGISKVGSYTGNGTSQTINCGFTTGARFVLIKRTDSTGDWYVWDSARGIVAGNDPYLSLNTTAAEVTTDDSVDTDNSGFIVNQLAATNINVTSATYIFLAIA